MITNLHIRYPNKSQIIKSFALILIQPQDNTIRLPESLGPNQSVFFENIIFIVYGNFPSNLRLDFQQYLISPKEDDLPKNVFHFEGNHLWYVKDLIGKFSMMPSAKTCIFSINELFHMYQEISDVYQDDIKERKLSIFDPKVFSKMKEDEFLLDCNQAFLLTNQEKTLMKPILHKLLQKIQTTSQNIPKQIMQLINMVENITKGQIESNKLTDQVDADKLSCLVFYEFVANGIIKVNQDIYQSIMFRKFRSVKSFESINEVQFKLPESQSHQNAANLQTTTPIPPVKTNQAPHLIESGSAPATTQNLKQQVNVMIPQSLSQSSSGPQKQVLLLQQPKQNLNEVPDSFKPCFQTIVKSLIHNVLSVFFSSNIVNIRKPSSLINSIKNYSNQEITKRQKGKFMTETERQLLSIMSDKTSSYHNLTSLNVLLFMHQHNCLKLNSDKDVCYEVVKIEQLTKNNIDQLISPNNIVYSLQVGDDFVNRPYSVINEQLRLFNQGKQLTYENRDYSQSTNDTSTMFTSTLDPSYLSGHSSSSQRGKPQAKSDFGGQQHQFSSGKKSSNLSKGSSLMGGANQKDFQMMQQNQKNYQPQRTDPFFDDNFDDDDN